MPTPIDRREAIRRVSLLLGGVSLVGGNALLAACQRHRPPVADGAKIGDFTPEDVAFLDEVAETILPATSTPGAKAARVGAFMALMVTDTYDPKDQKLFRDGMRTLDEGSRKANGGATFMSATPQQRLAMLERLDREQKQQADAREAAERARMAGPAAAAEAKETQAERADVRLPDQRKEGGASPDVAGAASITDADAPTHYFRMMKELTLLGYFTSEIGYTQAMRYIESPGRFDPCAPYTPGEKAWAPHA